jgi:hypothetical protein
VCVCVSVCVCECECECVCVCVVCVSVSCVVCSSTEPRSQSLTWLSIADNGITSIGAHAVSEALQRSSCKLKFLNL